MPRPLFGLLVALVALFGPCVAIFSVLFGALTCETGCAGGPEWAQHRDSAEWDLYGRIGLAFAVGTTVLTIGACAARRTIALVGLVGAIVAGAILQWRVALVSGNSAADLSIWLLAGLAVAVTVVVCTRPRATSSPR